MNVRLTRVWDSLPPPLRMLVGVVGSAITLFIFWSIVLGPFNWPAISLVGRYFLESVSSSDMHWSFLATGVRAVLSLLLGFFLAVVFAILTGRTILGWIFFFFLLVTLQKIPAIAMVHVMVRSSLGLGFAMTIALATTVVMTFTWLVLHHRASTLDPREVFALKVLGLRGWRLGLYGTLPHLGSALGGGARLAGSIALVMVVVGEWQGIWSGSSWMEHGLGSYISRQYDTIDSEAKVLAGCLWLGLLGIGIDGAVRGLLLLIRRLIGVDLQR